MANLFSSAVHLPLTGAHGMSRRVSVEIAVSHSQSKADDPVSFLPDDLRLSTDAGEGFPRGSYCGRS